MEKREFSAKTVALATENGLKELGLTEDQAVIEIIEQGGGLFKKAKVLISKKLSEAEIAQEFVEGLLDRMKINCVVDLEPAENGFLIDLKTTETSTLIGYRGDVLDAIQYLASLVSNETNENFTRIVVDCEGYRAKREETLKKLAINLAKKSASTSRVVELEAMNPYERRIIHSTLQNDRFVYTKSKGDDPDRHVIIIPKRRNNSNSNYKRNDNKKPYDKKPYSERNNNSSREQKTSSPQKKSSSFGFGTYLGKAEKTEENN